MRLPWAAAAPGQRALISLVMGLLPFSEVYSLPLEADGGEWAAAALGWQGAQAEGEAHGAPMWVAPACSQALLQAALEMREESHQPMGRPIIMQAEAEERAP